MNTTPVKRVLLSVSDKTGLKDFAQALSRQGAELVSTGGTARLMRDAGLTVREVADVTGLPEMLDGRVKTLHPKIHGGLLARRDDPGHTRTMTDHQIAGIDLLVCNLYPFEETLAGGADAATIIENIDIGGPAMIRSAAKNHAHVAVVVDPADYALLEAELADRGGIGFDLRQKLAAKAFARTAAYDSAISGWFAAMTGEEAPAYRSFAGPLHQTLRYGENPHQKAALYLSGPGRPGVATARQIQGKELSYNNIADTDAAFELVSEFDPAESAAVAIIKHANPSGMATGQDALEAYERALLCDPVSAFGGIVALNRTLDRQAAEKIAEIFTEVIVAPDADQDALDLLAAKKNLRVLLTGGLANPLEPGVMVRNIAGGLLVQSRDTGRVGAADWKVVTKRAPTDQETADLAFAFRVAKHVKSNAIVYAKNGASVGIGAGQMSRLDSSRIAAIKARDAAKAAGLEEPLTQGSVVASDAFFPFPDGMLAAAEAGATAVIQPGGAMRDDDVIAAADEAGLAMVLTGMRHFRH